MHTHTHARMYTHTHTHTQIQSILEGAEVMDEETSGLPSNPEDLATLIEDVESKITNLQTSIVQEEAKMEKYRVSS